MAVIEISETREHAESHNSSVRACSQGKMLFGISTIRLDLLGWINRRKRRKGGGGERNYMPVIHDPYSILWSFLISSSCLFQTSKQNLNYKDIITDNPPKKKTVFMLSTTLFFNFALRSYNLKYYVLLLIDHKIMIKK